MRVSIRQNNRRPSDFYIADFKNQSDTENIHVTQPVV